MKINILKKIKEMDISDAMKLSTLEKAYNKLRLGIKELEPVNLYKHLGFSSTYKLYEIFYDSLINHKIHVINFGGFPYKWYIAELLTKYFGCIAIVYDEIPLLNNNNIILTINIIDSFTTDFVFVLFYDSTINFNCKYNIEHSNFFIVGSYCFCCSHIISFHIIENGIHLIYQNDKDIIKSDLIIDQKLIAPYLKALTYLMIYSNSNSNPYFIF